MKRTSLIRLGGLAAMVGGALYAAQALLWPLVMQLAFPNTSYYEAEVQSRVPFYLEVAFPFFLVLGAMAATVALYILQKEHRRVVMTLAFLLAFLGVALTLWLLGLSLLQRFIDFPALTLVLIGVLLGTVGIIALGVVTITAGILSWWGGVALIAGSPLVGFFFAYYAMATEMFWLFEEPWVSIIFGLFGFFDQILNSTGVSPELLLLGVPWSVVGFAIFRAAARQSRQPSRVR